MKLTETSLPGVVIIEPQLFEDSRGAFFESHNQRMLSEAGYDLQFVQDNQSTSRRVGTLRGLHYQLPPHAQTKLVRVVTGAIYDVAVDIRPWSETFGQWLGVVLSASNHRQLLIPKGYAHGFCTITSDTTVLYKVDDYYALNCERGIAWNDETLGITWPVSEPILSHKDALHPTLLEADVFPPTD